MTPEQMMEKIEIFLEGYNSFNIEAMLSVLDPDIVFLNTSSGVTNVETRGLEAFRDLAGQSLPVFSFRRQIITEHSAISGGIEVKIDYEAVLANDMPGGLKAGEKLTLKGRSVYMFKDNAISFIEDIT